MLGEPDVSARLDNVHRFMAGVYFSTGLIAIFIRLTLRGERQSAVQSATGFFYLAVITAFTAELAAKVRFLP